MGRNVGIEVGWGSGVNVTSKSKQLARTFSPKSLKTGRAGEMIPEVWGGG